jgi:hypothetical protein
VTSSFSDRSLAQPGGESAPDLDRPHRRAPGEQVAGRLTGARADLDDPGSRRKQREEVVEQRGRVARAHFGVHVGDGVERQARIIRSGHTSQCHMAASGP